MKTWRIQCHPFTDHITGEGEQLQRRPYPIVVNEKGDAVAPNHLIAGVIGFVADLARFEVDVWWDEAQKRPGEMVGMYVIIADEEGDWSTFSTAVESCAEVIEERV